MVTIAINTQQGTDMKQMQIYTDTLGPYIELIVAKLRAQELEVKTMGLELTPPYVFLGITDSEASWQFPPIEFAIESALRYLQKTMDLDSKEWETTVNEYVNIPSRSSGKTTVEQEGMSRYRTRQSTIDLCESLGKHIAENSTVIEVPFIYSRWGISYKVVANLALIWLGRKLRAEKEETARSESN
jgi:hypothetical protein